MIILNILIVVLIIINFIIYNPKLDKTSEGDILLWYDYKNKRKYKVIWKMK